MLGSICFTQRCAGSMLLHASGLASSLSLPSDASSPSRPSPSPPPAAPLPLPPSDRQTLPRALTYRSKMSEFHSKSAAASSGSSGIGGAGGRASEMLFGPTGGFDSSAIPVAPMSMSIMSTSGGLMAAISSRRRSVVSRSSMFVASASRSSERPTNASVMAFSRRYTASADTKLNRSSDRSGRKCSTSETGSTQPRCTAAQPSVAPSRNSSKSGIVAHPLRAKVSASVPHNALQSAFFTGSIRVLRRS
mmetsp:Transcript_27368/g.71763  ORF Transcript_27368/g.71763 Transcript_27368/m.71763 type:complete len:248 (-) Transcript_27368:112-855(-)